MPIGIYNLEDNIMQVVSLFSLHFFFLKVLETISGRGHVKDSYDKIYICYNFVLLRKVLASTMKVGILSARVGYCIFLEFSLQLTTINTLSMHHILPWQLVWGWAALLQQR